MEYIHNYLPLFSTLLGGLLAISGGVASSILIQRYSKKRDRDKLVREKGEELYKMILKLDHYTHFIGNIMQENELDRTAPEEVKLSQYEYKQVEMLVGLYFPSVTKTAQEYTSIRKKHMLSYMRCVFNRAEGNDIIDDDFIKEVKEIREKYDVKSETLKQEIKKYFPL